MTVMPDVALAALFSPLSVPESESVIERLRLSGRQVALVRDTIELKESEAQIRAVANQPSMLVRMLAGVDPAAVSAWAELCPDEVVAGALGRYASELRYVKPELSGAELLRLGVVQGPEVGRMLDRLRDARLDGKLKSKEEEVSLVRDIMTHLETSLTK